MYGIESPQDFLEMNRDGIKALEHLDESRTPQLLHRGSQCRVQVMKVFFLHLRNEVIDDITTLTYEDFNDYCIDIYDANTLPTVPSAKSKEPSASFTTHQPTEEFKRGVKRDKAATVEDEKLSFSSTRPQRTVQTHEQVNFIGDNNTTFNIDTDTNTFTVHSTDRIGRPHPNADSNHLSLEINGIVFLLMIRSFATNQSYHPWFKETYVYTDTYRYENQPP